MSKVVRAAGGVVWRGDEVLLVHRPRYDDWSLPKGKLDPGEHRLAAAVREVFEETGVLAAPAVALAPVRYLTGEPGVEKFVTYWTMRPLNDADREPTDEVDDVAWLPLAAARERLTYTHDRSVVAEFAAIPPVSGTVVLVRHALAGNEDAWDGPDDERPLDSTGRRDAGRATDLLRLFAPEAVVSAPPLRCRETVAGVGPAVAVDPRFAEAANVAAAEAALRGFALAATATVVCSQGRLLRPLVARLRAAVGVAGGAEVETDKGTGWVLTYTAAGSLVAVDPLDLRAEAT